MRTTKYKCVMDAETVHNWRNRHMGLPHYEGLSQIIRKEIRDAHDRHHSKGTDAAEEARALIAAWPDELSPTGT